MRARSLSLAVSVLAIIAVGAGCNTSNFSGGSQKEGAREKPTDDSGDAKPQNTQTDLGQQNPVVPEEVITPGVATATGTVSPDIPADAVVQGSFTVWTVPADPSPAQPYTIMIEVRLPPTATNYTVQDLSGMVIGTDGYEQPLGGSAGIMGALQNMTVAPGSARLSVLVPGAEQLVRDTIDVRSTLLNEQQRIELVF